MERAVSLEAIYGMVWQMLDEANRMTDGEAGWLHDVYRDDYGNLFAVVNQGGKLYRAPLTVQQDQVTLGEWEHVVTEFAPVRSKIRTLRMANGDDVVVVHLVLGGTEPRRRDRQPGVVPVV